MTVPTSPAMNTPAQKGSFGPPTLEKIVAAGTILADTLVRPLSQYNHEEQNAKDKAARRFL